jgi:nucleotide-binding universal stress UspA family protein
MNALLVIDGGPGTEQALERAYDLLADQQGTLTLLHVIPSSPFYGRGLPVWEDCDELAAEEARSQALLEEDARRLRERGVRFTIETACASGDPAQEIVRAAEVSAEVIILGRPLGTTDSSTMSSSLAGETREPAEVTAERHLAPV